MTKRFNYPLLDLVRRFQLQEVVVDVTLATVPIKRTANVFCTVVDKQGNIADRKELMPL